MQEFAFIGKRVLGCFPAFQNGQDTLTSDESLDGFFVWTNSGVYECRQKVLSSFFAFVLFSFIPN